MHPPLIGITTGTVESGPEGDRLNRSYGRAVRLAGGLPVAITNVGGVPAREAAARLDGLLLSGGRDVAPARYGETTLNGTVEEDAARDGVEIPLIAEALRRDLPTLAICRGIQALNVALGGTLWQDIPAQVPGALAHRQEAPRAEATHAIDLEAGSRLAAVVGAGSWRVNTFHHQALRRIAAGLAVSARAEDGIIEGVEAPDAAFVLAVQFHPEDMVRACSRCQSLFTAFVRAAAGRSAARAAR